MHEKRETSMDSTAGKNDSIHGKNGLENDGDFVINVECWGGERSDVGGSGGAEKEGRICRVCLMSSDCVSQSGDLIQLGCRCRGDLGTAHRNCAELWFAMKGNRVCEICGMVATNVTGVGDHDFMLEWNDMPRTSYSYRSIEWRLKATRDAYTPKTPSDLTYAALDRLSQKLKNCFRFWLGKGYEDN